MTLEEFVNLLYKSSRWSGRDQRNSRLVDIAVSYQGVDVRLHMTYQDDMTGARFGQVLSFPVELFSEYKGEAGSGNKYPKFVTR